MAKSPAKEAQLIVIPEIAEGQVIIEVTGISSLICHNFGEKSKKQMLDKQLGKPRMKKAAKDPQQDFKDSLYPLPGKKGRFGFPASGFKKAMVSACRYVDGINMTYAKGAFHVDGDLLEILNTKPKMREDVVRLNSGPSPVADLRYRAEFSEGWKVKVPISFNRRAINAESIANLLNIAGRSVGVGEWRPEKSGNFGRFKIARFFEVA
jgi:hypothetical protein